MYISARTKDIFTTRFIRNKNCLKNHVIENLFKKKKQITFPTIPLHHYHRDRGGAFGSSAPEIGINWAPDLEPWSPSPYPYPWESGAGCVAHFLIWAPGDSIGAEHFLIFTII